MLPTPLVYRSFFRSDNVVPLQPIVITVVEADLAAQLDVLFGHEPHARPATVALVYALGVQVVVRGGSMVHEPCPQALVLVLGVNVHPPCVCCQTNRGREGHTIEVAPRNLAQHQSLLVRWPAIGGRYSRSLTSSSTTSPKYLPTNCFDPKSLPGHRTEGKVGRQAPPGWRVHSDPGHAIILVTGVKGAIVSYIANALQGLPCRC
jgi:hypothetical protein